ncbi:MAG: CoA ester lyase [Beijerinckiaceae bacterium]|nr:CoA ester lyase [Beijerinckiaceae bacterium]
MKKDPAETDLQRSGQVPLRLPPRSLLYVPAANERALAKTGGLMCDAIIVDLEDSVAPAEKAAARASAIRFLEAAPVDGPWLVLRVNGLDTPWAAADIAALASCQRLPAVLLPKASRRADVETLDRMLDEAGAPPHLALWLMIETAAGLFDLPSVLAAASRRRVEALVLGLNDLAKETRVAPGEARANLVPWMLHSVLAARARGLFIFDGVFNAFRDADGLSREARQAHELGFDGKTLIHPTQIAPTNAAFSPAEAALKRARRIVAAFETAENRAKGVISLDGEMIELLHRDEALALLHRATRA